jgi:hypothetical protein
MTPSAAGIDPSIVIAGLDPAIHPFNEMVFLMDARVKPGHDEARAAAGTV